MCMGGPTLGASDVVPPGLRAPGQPGMGPLPGVPGLGGTGGMHMGPNDPLFGGHPGIRPPGGMAGPGRGGMPPGARWDPIAPPGMRVGGCVSSLLAVEDMAALPDAKC